MGQLLALRFVPEAVSLQPLRVPSHPNSTIKGCTWMVIALLSRTIRQEVPSGKIDTVGTMRLTASVLYAGNAKWKQ